jgi:antitoxin ParD1/3/4
MATLFKVASPCADDIHCAIFVIVVSCALHKEHLAMNVSIGERWEKFVESTVQKGRYSSASEVVREGLRLVEEREAKLTALRETLNASITAGGDVSDDELDAALAAEAQDLAREGF